MATADSSFSFKKVVVALLLGYACAAAWVIYADTVYNNHVALEDYEFHSLYGISLGVSAIVTALLFDRNLKSVGLRRFKIKYLLLAFAVAAIVILVPFLLNIIIGVAYFNPKPVFDQEMMVMGIPVLIILSLGEEVMWRGILYSELSKKYSFATTSIIIGLLWAIWHYPVIIHTKFIYADRPLWFVLPAFTIMVVCGNFVYNYIRRISNSIWPCVFLHAAINYIVFVVVEPLEKAKTTNAIYFMSDIGVFYVVIFIAGMFWVNRKLRIQTV